MNFLKPIFTEARECHDCYKCVRNCPVKAIKLENGIASVIPELCVLCGRCVEVCPSGAKKVRDDLLRARQLLRLKDRVYVSLAPSFVTEFPGVRPGQVIAALRRLGFAGVSETALGAQLVSAQLARELADGPARVVYSSACPTAVSWLQKYHPERARNIAQMHSPVIAHCKLLRERLGAGIGIVFVSPCIAKKSEADAHPELLDVAITFAELRRWLAQERIELAAVPEAGDERFVPEAAEEGALYPIDGGMVAGIRAHCGVADDAFMAISGLRCLERSLDGIEGIALQRSLFIELLACSGGCVNGPQSATREGTVLKRHSVLQRARYPAEAIPRAPQLDLAAPQRADAVQPSAWRESQIREVLRSVGKDRVEDELNCSGCGYDSCRDFARALLAGKAERAMCVAHMRKLALKKANALIRKMPSAVVIADASGRIIECNEPFAKMFARDELAGEDAGMPLEGASLAKVVPFAALFNRVLKTGEDLLDRDLRCRDSILHGSIFSIEKHCVVGGIFQDITRPAVQKEQVIQKAQEVIRKNLETVQKIAYLLGENASESEIILDSIIESFSTREVPEPDDGRSGNDWKRLYRG